MATAFRVTAPGLYEDSELPLADASQWEPVMANDVPQTPGNYDSAESAFLRIVGKGFSTITDLGSAWLKNNFERQAFQDRNDASIQRMRELQAASDTANAQAAVQMQRNTMYIIIAAVAAIALIALSRAFK